MSIAVLVNLRARRGSEAIGRMVRALLPSARLAVTRSLDEARRWIADELGPNPPRLLLSGGGDGTAVTLLNELRDTGLPIPALGLLPLGTGNGWARATGTPKAVRAIRNIAALAGEAPPLRAFSLVEIEGKVTPFGGTGWDAEIVSDYQKQLALLPAELREASGGLGGYLRSMFTRTIPRHLFGWKPPVVTLTNLGDDALKVDESGALVRVPGGTKGSVLYRGPMSVAGAGTIEELGLGFRAFPFAHASPGRVAVRIYAAGAGEATRNMYRLWRGVHPLPKSHDWLLTRWRMEFDRDVPLEIGGDVVGDRRTVDFRIADEQVRVVDWSSMRRSAPPHLAVAV